MRAIFAAIMVAVLASHSPAWAEDQKDVVFESAGVKISGTTVFPAERRPIAGVVIVHGSGPQKRLDGLARTFATYGIAALTYDKRGVGNSGGVFVNSALAPNIELLAQDAAAALAILSDEPRLKGVPLGFFGISQAGWIAPVASRKTHLAKFMIFLSGPVTTLSEEDHFSKFAENDPKFWKTHSHEQVAAFMKTAQPLSGDVDPRGDLAAFKGPALWFFGGQDNSVPVDLSISNLEVLIKTESPASNIRCCLIRGTISGERVGSRSLHTWMSG